MMRPDEKSNTVEAAANSTDCQLISSEKGVRGEVENVNSDGSRYLIFESQKDPAFIAIGVPPGPDPALPGYTLKVEKLN